MSAKLKTHSGSKKRFKVTANGRIVHRKSNRNHILTKKAKKRKAHLKKNAALKQCDKPSVLQMLALS